MSEQSGGRPGNARGGPERGHEEYCAAVATEIAGFAEVVAGAAAGTPVPTCPDWTLAALIEHIGRIHRWVEHIVRHRAQERVSPRDLDLGLPDAEADYPQWLAAGAEPLVATLRKTDPGTEVWTWGAGRNAGWWSRRMLHETTVHRIDAELALGRDAEVDPRTAADGIEEFLENLLSLTSVASRMGDLGADGETVHLHAIDSDGEWMIRLGAGGFDWERGHGKGTVAVRGTTSDLLQFTYGRLRPTGDRLAVFGDRALLERWQQASAL